MRAPHDQPCLPLLRCARGELPANIALVHLFMQAQDDQEAARLLDQAIQHLELHGPTDGVVRLQRARELWESCPQSFAMIKEMLQIADGDGFSGNAPDPAFWTSVFDRAADLSPEAGVALYSLGRPEILRQATAEIVERMHAWHLLPSGHALLDIGCGSGRILRAVAPHVGRAIGVDVSPLMLEAAQRHSAVCGNIAVLRTSGRDLAMFANAQFDLVCAVDAFPYLVMSGLAEIHLQEAARVLRPQGKLLVLNYSYGRDPQTDRSEITRAAAHLGLTVRRNGTRDYSLWDGLSFLLEKNA
jgi:ubiquinone/menaquinone biosynthesis C-methylase UbiE